MLLFDVSIESLLAVALAVVALLVCIVLVRDLVRARRGGGELGLPSNLLDAHTVQHSGEHVQLRARTYDGKRVDMLIDPRHAHVLSDDLLRAVARGKEKVS